MIGWEKAITGGVDILKWFFHGRVETENAPARKVGFSGKGADVRERCSEEKSGGRAVMGSAVGKRAQGGRGCRKNRTFREG